MKSRIGPSTLGFLFVALALFLVHPAWAQTVPGHIGPSGSAPPPVRWVDSAPSASFTVNCSGRICVFDGSGSSDDVGIVDWEWNLGDGATAGGGSSVAHLYASAGTYVVTLAVTDTSGQITSIATLVHVSG